MYKQITCQYSGCMSRACFGYKKTAKKIFCRMHAYDVMIHIKSRKCIIDECTKQALYNFKYEKRGLYCKNHMHDNMCDVRHAMCVEDSCLLRAKYGYITTKKKLLCEIHKKDNMININTHCSTLLCENKTSYGDKFCEQHTPVGSVANPRKMKCVCRHKNCTKIASFGHVGSGIKLFCSLHAQQNMINLSYTICNFNDCRQRALYYYDNARDIKYCELHKNDDMIYRKRTTCEIIQKKRKKSDSTHIAINVEKIT